MKIVLITMFLIMVGLVMFPGLGFSQDDPKVEAKAKDTDLKKSKNIYAKARLFTGIALSNDGTESPMVVTVLESADGKIVKILTTFFVPDAINLIIHAKDINVDKRGIKFTGVTKDPRGFKITWSAFIKGSSLTGTFSQPNDTGQLKLKEVDQKAVSK
jgi:hypothetical protein